MSNNLDTLATALDVTTDHLLKETPERGPWRPKVSIVSQLSDAELAAAAIEWVRAKLGHHTSPHDAYRYMLTRRMPGVLIFVADRLRTHRARVEHDPVFRRLLRSDPADTHAQPALSRPPESPSPNLYI